jgi:hypothetical protein
MDEIIFDNRIFISSKRASRNYGYTKDYIGQLARAGRIDARLVGRNWYVDERSLAAHKGGDYVRDARRSSFESREPLGSGYGVTSRDLGTARSSISSDLNQRRSEQVLNNPYLRSEIKYESDNSSSLPNLPVIKKKAPKISTDESVLTRKKMVVTEEAENLEETDDTGAVEAPISAHTSPESAYSPISSHDDLSTDSARLRGRGLLVATAAIFVLTFTVLSPYIDVIYSYTSVGSNDMTTKVEIILGSAGTILEI